MAKCQESRLAAKIICSVTAKIQSLREKKPDLNLKFSLIPNVFGNECFDSFLVRVDWDEEGKTRKKAYLCLAPKDEFHKTKNFANTDSDVTKSLQISFSLYQEFKTRVGKLRHILDGLDPKDDYLLILYWIHDIRPKYVTQIPSCHLPVIGTFELTKTSSPNEDDTLLQTALSKADESLRNEYFSNLMLENARIEAPKLNKLLKNALQQYLCTKTSWAHGGTIIEKYLDYIEKELWESETVLSQDSVKLHEIVRNYLNAHHKTIPCDSSFKNTMIQQDHNCYLSYIIVPEVPPILRCSRVKQVIEYSDRFLIVTPQNLREWSPTILKSICQNEELCTELILSAVSIDDEVKEFLECIAGSTCRIKIVSPKWKEETHEFLLLLKERGKAKTSYSSWTEKWSESQRDRLPVLPLRRLPGSSSDHGILFEAKMAALVALRARRHGLRFQLHVNVAAVRPWDDLVLRVEGPVQTGTWMVQLKHADKGGHVPLQAFLGGEITGKKKEKVAKDAGDFSLGKYYSTFQRLSEKYKNKEDLENNDDWLLCSSKLEDFRFLIYTNKEVEKPSSQSQADGSTVTDFPFEDLLETGDGTNTFSFQDGDEVWSMLDDDSFRHQFLPRLRVFGSQAHVDGLDRGHRNTRPQQRFVTSSPVVTSRFAAFSCLSDEGLPTLYETLEKFHNCLTTTILPYESTSRIT